MKKKVIIIYVLFFSGIMLFYSCQKSAEKKNYVKTDGPEIVPFRALQFDLENVKLKEGPFLKAMKLNEKILLNYEPDRFLANFRIEAGLKPKAEHYGGWESESLTGHSLGHYLSACSMMYKLSLIHI